MRKFKILLLRKRNEAKSLQKKQKKVVQGFHNIFVEVDMDIFILFC